MAQEANEAWRKSHNDEFHDLYSGFRESRWTWHAARLVETFVQGFDGEICMKDTMWKNWDWWEDNIQMDLKVMGYEGMASINLA
jgi:hypothetical protein